MLTIIPAFDSGGAGSGGALVLLQVARQPKVFHQLVTGCRQQDLPRVVWQGILPVLEGEVCEQNTESDPFRTLCD